MGYGGSIFQWHPKLKIGFAYVPTLLEFHDMYNQRGGRLQVRIPLALLYSLTGRGGALRSEDGKEPIVIFLFPLLFKTWCYLNGCPH